MNKLLLTVSIFVMGFLFSCQSKTTFKNPETVDNFKLDSYLGTWYEIARTDNRFEKGLEQVTANYSLNEDGTVKVLNKGFSPEKDKWKQAEGKAKFREKETEGKLKVSFFGTFYADYNIMKLDENYQYALVIGENLDYMWILSRETSIPETVKDNYLKKAEELGFDTEKLIWVNQK